MRASVSGSTQRSGESRFAQTASISLPGSRPSRVARVPPLPTWLSTSQPNCRSSSFASAPSGHARRRLPRRSSLQNVARIVKIKLQPARQVGVARTRSGQRAPRAAILSAILDGHGLLPVGPVAIFDAQRDGRADRLPVPNAGQRLDVVLLDLLPAAAPVAQLAPVQVAVDKIEVDAQTCGQPGTQAISACPCDSPAVTNCSISCPGSCARITRGAKRREG